MFLAFTEYFLSAKIGLLIFKIAFKHISRVFTIEMRAMFFLEMEVGVLSSIFNFGD